MRTTTLFALLALAACSQPPPPVAPAPEPPPAAPAPPPEPPPPPPPPKCEALEEKCVAGDTSRLAIGKASAKPPLGWTYAHEAKASITVSPAGDGVLAFATAGAESPEAELAAVTELLAHLGVTDVKAPLLKTRLKKPQSTVLADGGTTVKLWEVDKDNHGGVDPKKDGKPGAALIAIAKVGAAVVVSVGFVPKGAPAANVAAMMDTLKTLRSEP